MFEDRMAKIYNRFYAPDFEEVEGGVVVWARPFVRLSVRPSVTPFVGCKTRELLV